MEIQDEMKPSLTTFVAVAIVEWHKRHGEKGADGRPQADTARSLEALAEVAGELVARLPSREMRRTARAKFEARFRKSHAAMGRG